MFGRIFIAALAVTAVIGTSTATAQEDDKRATPVLPMGAGDDLFRRKIPVTRDSEAVQQLIAANPGRELIICVAGCKAGHASIIWQRPAAVALVDGGGGFAGLRSTRFDEAQSVPSKVSTDGENSTDVVVCIAGCDGPVGLVVYRGIRLAWIRDDRKEYLAEALRRIGERLAKADQLEASAQPQRAWVADTARAGLAAAMGNNDIVAFDRVNAVREDIKPSG